MRVVNFVLPQNVCRTSRYASEWETPYEKHEVFHQCYNECFSHLLVAGFSSLISLRFSFIVLSITICRTAWELRCKERLEYAYDQNSVWYKLCTDLKQRDTKGCIDNQIITIDVL